MKQGLVAAAFALSVLGQPVWAASDIVVDGDRLPCAYTALVAGDNAAVVASLRGERADPSRLINLGTAYARLGQKADAVAAYRAARSSDVRYDLELADGSWMDSRAAARLALARLEGKGTLLAAR